MRRNRRRLFTLLVLLALALNACGAPPEQADERALPPLPRPEQIYLPSVAGAGQALMVPAAALSGISVLSERGCLRVQTPDGESHLVIWASAVRAERDASGKIVIRDDDGRVRIGIGQRVSLGGGPFHPEQRARVPALMAEAQARCGGPYWIIGEAHPEGWRAPPVPAPPGAIAAELAHQTETAPEPTNAPELKSARQTEIAR